MIRFARFETAFSQTVASAAGALICAAIFLGAALPLAPIA